MSSRYLPLALFVLVRVLCSGWALFGPIVIPYWKMHELGLWEMATLEWSFSVLALLLDTPCGYLSDRFGRKKALVVGSWFLALASTLYGLGRGFGDLLVAELCFAPGVVLSMGASEALLKELCERQQVEHDSVVSVTGTIQAIAIAALSALGVQLFRLNHRLPFLGAGCMFALAGLAACFMRETCSPEAAPKVVFEGLQHCLVKDCRARGLIVMQAGLLIFLGATALYYEPYLRASQVNQWYDWLIFASFAIVAASAASLVPKLVGRYGMQRLAWRLLALVGAGLLLLGGVHSVASFVFIAGLQFTRGCTDVMFNAPFNRLVEDRIRASSVAAKNMLCRLAEVSGKTIGFFLVAKFGLHGAWFLMGFIATVITGSIWIRLRER